ncbi:MAG: hypothetical protein GXO61_05765 [Epsilonproteobacteria bacterium]|nr:hypothetical protein [Campylobacterota bacterium]
MKLFLGDFKVFGGKGFKKMRLTKKEIIKEIIKTLLGEKSEIYLFGSRVNKEKKGG